MNTVAKRKNQHKKTKATNSHLLFVLAVGIGAGIVGVVTVKLAGEGLHSAPPEKIPSLGWLEYIRLPYDMRELDKVKTFVVSTDGADDYGRVYVNNYLALDTEDPKNVFIVNGNSEQDKIPRATVESMARDRADKMFGPKDVKVFLHKGKNYVVAELENSVFGTCEMNIDIKINGIEVEHLPETFPENFEVEKEVAQPTLLGLFDKNDQSYASEPDLSLSSLANALCARRIFEVDLK